MILTYQPRRTDINLCWKVSKFRYAVNKDLGWAHSHKEWAWKIGFIGALGELAASKLFGIEWDGAMLKKATYLKWRKRFADLGPFEIKTVHKSVGNLQIKPADKSFARALLMLAPNSFDAAGELLKGNSPMVPPVRLLGYMDVSEAKKTGTWYPEPHDSTKGKWVVLRKNLKDPNDLAKYMEMFDKKRKTQVWVKGGNIPPFRLTQ